MNEFIRKALLLFFVGFFYIFSFGQSVTNGNLSTGNTNWGCGPEVGDESTYGGTGSNQVAEIDASSGLCQTISGFTIGYIYELDFLCSRRTSCGPTFQAISVTVSGGALSTTVYRNGSSFSLASESFSFVATSTSQTLTFSGTSTGNCGLIIDNIEINFLALPVELISFKGHTRDHKNHLFWNTASEVNNREFVIERSIDGAFWTSIGNIAGKGNSNSITNYEFIDESAFRTVNYYRLKQIDFNGSFDYSSVVTLVSEASKNSFIVTHSFKNQSIIIIPKDSKKRIQRIQMYNSNGREVTNKAILNSDKTTIAVSSLYPGMYVLVVNYEVYKCQVFHL
ncbi:MAG: hypothetical protein COA58_04010 [Bacteroidetes bacterium]|nr:MAG: hypothetical protein COA58_04010 [Bacteroidota bacterium]